MGRVDDSYVSDLGLILANSVNFIIDSKGRLNFQKCLSVHGGGSASRGLLPGGGFRLQGVLRPRGLFRGGGGLPNPQYWHLVVATA